MFLFVIPKLILLSGKISKVLSREFLEEKMMLIFLGKELLCLFHSRHYCQVSSRKIKRLELQNE